jgi:5-methyltetrahydrofolate--homocysteine methyltransferase
MVHVAKEMERRGFDLPLLIGGATTSREHTAVRIAPAYHVSTVHVLDASRAVGVVASLLDPERRDAFDQENRGQQQRLRDLYAHKAARPLVSFAEADANKPKYEWRRESVAVPEFLGRRVLDDFPLDVLRRYIDWRFFFTAWELPGRFPQVLDDPKYGEAARDLYHNATVLLDRIIAEKLLRARGVYGFWPAQSEGNDIVVYADESRRRELLRFSMLREQRGKANGEPQLSLADFVAPVASGVPDYIGAFAVTAGVGTDELVRRFEAAHDDYSAIIVKALADRLAEAFAEALHERVRREWGYGTGEALAFEDLLKERYRGIRPAFGYPACPDHSEKQKLFELLDAPAVGLTLTEHFAMLPASSVSGIYLAHPQARYFSVGRIGRDQVAAYATRKHAAVAEVERWLSPNLG